jgi:transcriptional regulator with XRE-family HTH domain
MEIRVWEARQQKGYTLIQLEGITGISKSTLNNIENGKTSPTLSQLECIASALGVRITDLFDSDLK